MKTIIDYLQSYLPSAGIKQYPLPDCPQLVLWLLDDDFSDRDLSSRQVEKLSNDPPYWIFCWASGHALAARILQGGINVADKTILDFGAGSGVVAIAAAMAGAKHVIACEIDAVAREMIRLNSKLNGVKLGIANSLEQVVDNVDMVLAADVLYEAKNLVWLDEFLLKSEKVVLADSRLKRLKHPAYHHVATVITTSFPDYHEAKANNEVRFYQSYLEPE